MVLTWMPEVVKYGISNLTLIGGCERHQDQPKTKVRLRSIKYKIVLKSTKCMVRLKLSRKGWRLTLPSLSSPTTEGRPKWALIRYSCHWLQCHWVTKMCSKWKSSLFLRGRTWWSKSLHSAQGHTCNGLIKNKIVQNFIKDQFYRTTVSTSNWPIVVLNLGESASWGTGITISTLFAVDLKNRMNFSIICYPSLLFSVKQKCVNL